MAASDMAVSLYGDESEWLRREGEREGMLLERVRLREVGKSASSSIFSFQETREPERPERFERPEREVPAREAPPSASR